MYLQLAEAARWGKASSVKYLPKLTISRWRRREKLDQKETCIGSYFFVVDDGHTFLSRSFEGVPSRSAPPLPLNSSRPTSLLKSSRWSLIG